jgi:hypothetical protein
MQMQYRKVLEECGLVRTEKVGRTRTCPIETAGFSSWGCRVAAPKPHAGRIWKHPATYDARLLCRRGSIVQALPQSAFPAPDAGQKKF